MSIPRFIAAFAFLSVAAQGDPHERDAAWAKIAQYFIPPTEYAGRYSTHPSPLRFEDGGPVETPEQWIRRRQEILRTWHGLMGTWPPLLENPTVKVLEETRRGTILQRRVLVEIVERQMTPGWLLLPEGQGPFPSVLIPYYEPETSIGLSTNQFRDFGYQLTRRGFVTLSIGSPGGEARKPDPGRAHWQPLSFLAYVAAKPFDLVSFIKESYRHGWKIL